MVTEGRVSAVASPLFAQKVSEIATASELKLELRLTGDLGEQDAMLSRHVEAGLALVEELTSLPLLDSWYWRDVPEGFYPTDRMFMVYRGDRPLVVEAAFLQKVTYFQYVPVEGNLYDAATNVHLIEAQFGIHMSNGPLSKISGAPVISRLSVYAKPGFSWPAHHEDVRPRVWVGVGIKTTAVLKQAVLAAAKGFYQGDPDGAKEMVEHLVGSSMYFGE